MSTTKHGEKTFHIKSFGIGTFSTNDIMFSECFLQLDSKQILESKYKIVAKTSRADSSDSRSIHFWRYISRGLL